MDNPEKPVSLYRMYRELQAENVRLKAEVNLLQSLVESWTSRFEKLLQTQNAPATVATAAAGKSQKTK
jgi:hypothetical protein